MYYFIAHTPYAQLITWCTEHCCSRVKHLYFAVKDRTDTKVCLVPWYLSIRVELVIQETSDCVLQSLETKALFNVGDQTRHAIHCAKCMSIV